MKRIIWSLFALILIMNLTSCSTTEKIIVYGQEGTEIYTPTQEKLGIINNNGSANITLSSDACYTYLLAKNNNSELYVPFALDYKNKSYVGSKMLLGTEYVLFTTSLITTIAAAIAAGEDDAPLAAVGFVAIPTAFGGMATSARLNQTTRRWNFSYLDKQQTNSDICFTQPVYSEPEKTIVRQSANRAKSGKSRNAKLPFKSGKVLQVVTYFNGESLTVEPEGQVKINGNQININVIGNAHLKNRTFKITKYLKRKKRIGDSKRAYDLFETSDQQEIGLYFDDSFGFMGVPEQRILIPVDNSIYFEVVWM